jgi:hypothetical protein
LMWCSTFNISNIQSISSEGRLVPVFGTSSLDVIRL